MPHLTRQDCRSTCFSAPRFLNQTASRWLGGAAIALLLLAVGRQNANAGLIVNALSQPTSIDLTTEGSTDWISWSGLVSGAVDPSTTGAYARKNGGTGIGEVIYDGTLDAGGSIPLRTLGGNDHVTLTWTDGDPTVIWAGDSLAHPSGTTSTGILQAKANRPGGEGTSFTLPVTATSTNPGTLTFYVGNFRADSNLVATLAGSPDVSIPFNVLSGAASRMVVVNFQADNIGDILSLKYEDVGSNGTYSNLNIQAATLSYAVPEPTTALGLLGLVTSAFFRRRRRLLS